MDISTLLYRARTSVYGGLKGESTHIFSTQRHGHCYCSWSRERWQKRGTTLYHRIRIVCIRIAHTFYFNWFRKFFSWTSVTQTKHKTKYIVSRVTSCFIHVYRTFITSHFYKLFKISCILQNTPSKRYN